MTVTITPQNMQEVQKALREYGEKAVRAIGDAVQASALEITTDIKKRIQRGPATGRTYTRGEISHQASAPGEAPATDSGTLASSINYSKKAPLTAEIESRLPYATYLEFGTSRIGARPSWVPAVEAGTPKFQLRITTAIARLTR
jgi:hypothetical protein